MNGFIRNCHMLVSVLVLYFAEASAWADNPLVVPGNPCFPDVCFQPVGDTMFAFVGTDPETPGVRERLKKAL